MTMLQERRSRYLVFGVLTFGCVALALGYVVWRIWGRSPSMHGLLPPSDPSSLSDLKALQNRPHLVVINREQPYVGYVRLVGLDDQSPRIAQTRLACDRVHYAAGKGICLLRDTTSQQPGGIVSVTIFGADFEPLHSFKVDGIPSRCRVSPDGRYAVYTVFVSGHSYTDANMSTATVLIDTASGASLGSLEDFTTRRDGQRYQAPDFNFWGVTFARESDLFYATLQTHGTTFLVQGAIKTRSLTVLQAGIECPSLSPDGTRIAFKKLTPDHTWRLTVLDLSTLHETPLSEMRNVDDQVEWLDNQHILYQSIDPKPPPWMSIMKVPADGTGAPSVLVPGAISPAVVQ